MKAIKAEDLKVGKLYYDTKYKSTRLKLENKDSNTLYFSHHSGVNSYLIDDSGFIVFSLDNTFYQP